MRTMTPGQINAWRGVVVWGLRGASVLLLATGSYLVMKKVLFGLGTGDLNMIYGVWEDVGEGHSLYRGLAMLAVGTVLAARSRALSRWIIAVPPDDCPGCGYEREQSPEPGRCPECGLAGVGGVRSGGDTKAAS
jgi:hypothetical protein